MESELLDLLITARRYLDLGKLGLGDFHPGFGNEQPSVYLQAYLGRKSWKFEGAWRYPNITGRLHVL